MTKLFGLVLVVALMGCGSNQAKPVNACPPGEEGAQAAARLVAAQHYRVDPTVISVAPGAPLVFPRQVVVSVTVGDGTAEYVTLPCVDGRYGPGSMHS